jgi:HEAT repeat protein
MQDPKSFQVLKQTVETSGDDYVVTCAVEALCSLNKAGALTELESSDTFVMCLHSGQGLSFVREEIQRKGKEAIKLVDTFLSHSKPSKRKKVLVAIGDTSSALASDLIWRSMQNDADETVRQTAMLVLAHSCADKRAVAPLYAAASDFNSSFSFRALEALIDLDKTKAETIVKQRLSQEVQNVEKRAIFTTGLYPDGVIALGALTPEGEIRFKLVKAIGKIGDRSSVPLLIRCLNDPERSIDTFGVNYRTGVTGDNRTYYFRIRQAASETLKVITEQEFGADIDKWQHWWIQNNNQ